MKSIKIHTKKGIALPIVLAVILMLAFWIGNISWRLSQNRSQFQRIYKTRKAYFMARSSLEHLFLKLKMIQRHTTESMLAMENANDSEKKILYSAFTQDIIVPTDNNNTVKIYKYRVKDFNIESIDYKNSKITLQIAVEGNYSGQSSSISRLVRISR